MRSENRRSPFTLEVGAVVYSIGPRGVINGRYKINRTTKARAFIETGRTKIEFDREVRDRSYFWPRGGGRDVLRNHFSVETEELLSQYYRNLLVRRFNLIKVGDLSNQQIEQILEIALSTIA